jgi:hypothetical protein
LRTSEVAVGESRFDITTTVVPSSGKAAVSVFVPGAPLRVN